MLLTILLGIYFYSTCCSTCGGSTANEPPQQAVVPLTPEPEPTSYPFAVTDGDYDYHENDNYNFKASSSEILIPLAASMSAGITSVKAHLAANTGKILNIIGYYKSDETNTSAYPNLGIARANAVKNHLVSQGISSAQINTDGKLMSDMLAKDGVYLGPVAYSITGASDTAQDDLKLLYDKINDNPLVLYFDTAKAAIDLSPEQRQKVADISRYLDKVPDATLNVTGHTDNTGRTATNQRLGLDRANFAKSYFMQNGISEAKIVTKSKGETEPVVSNATEAGRTKNRRTVVTLN